MHSYIDYEKVHTFTTNKTLDDVITDLDDNYNITNINDDDESLYYIAKTLSDDYNNKIANYEAYIESNMNARMLMELRKSAVLLLEDELKDFYTGHCNCNSVSDVKNFRRNYLKELNEDYEDFNWQYYFLVKYNLRGKSKDFIFDFESCFADGSLSNQTDPEDYCREFVYAHTHSREEVLANIKQ